ncbi:MAG: response regulator [Thermodesulfobacteriota bacterium]
MIEKKILFVDDEESQRDVMERVLKRMGYQVTLSSSAENALEILQNECFPVIITDLNMPGMDGNTFCRRIREKDTRAFIYALSGYIEAYDDFKLAQIGFNGFLRKPTTYQMLKQAIEKAFDRLEGLADSP